MAGRVTIQDIADALGLSRNTVSKAINNSGILADATREKILQKAVEMGYKQFSYVSFNPAQQTQETSALQATVPILEPQEQAETPAVSGRTIALFTTIFLGNSHFSSTMLDKVQSELSRLGYSLTMHRVSTADLKNKTLPLSFNMENTAGILCFEMFDLEYSDMLCELGLPTVFVDAPASIFHGSLQADCLLMDNRSNLYSFVNEMAKRGKTKIGFVGEQFHCMSFFERYMAVREAHAMLQLPFDEKYCILSPNHAPEAMHPDASVYQAYLQEKLQNMKGLPDVFICANDFVAIDLLQAFRKLGISVPDDVLLCGFDDSPESRIVTPPLTTIHIHSQIMGFSAVHLLISRIQNPSLNYRTIYTETSLIYRESTDDRR